MEFSENKRIIQKLRNGDKDAFDSVYWKYRKAAYGFALRYLKDARLAEDAVQDVFLKLWENRTQLDSGKSLRGFLFSTLKNHVLNMLKSQKRRILRQFDYAGSREEKNETPEGVAFYADTERVVEEGLRQLPESKQLVFKLKSFEGYSNKEVAARLGISIHTVKSQFYRASRFLRKYVATRIDGINGRGG